MKIAEIYKQTNTTINTAVSLSNLVKGARDNYNERFLYTATLDEDSFIYNDIMRFINASSKTRNFKFVAARDGVMRLYDSERTVVFVLGDYKIKANLNKAAAENSESRTPISTVLNKKNTLTFTCSSAEAMNALENLFNTFVEERMKVSKNNYLCDPDGYGGWDYSPLPQKPIESVFLPMGVKEALIEDIEKFRGREQRFVNLGIPYRRGYALYGAPGNGKSSIALALANHFGLDLFNLPLSGFKDDKTLVKCISEVTSNSLLLIEDIDTYSGHISREQEGDGKSSLGGLLNSLDGVGTPHGMMTIMTTNHFDNLDAALVRPGRMDYKLELTAPNRYQIEQMFERVFDEPLGIEPKAFESMAAVSDVFKRNIEDAEVTRMELKHD